MALKDNASLALIPAAYKTSKIYSAIPTDGDGDFTFARSGNATRVNKAGLVETMGTNIGRLNYDLTNGTPASCPSLLLEPSRANNFLYSELFNNSYWIKENVSTATGITSPMGDTDAQNLIENTSFGRHRIRTGMFVSAYNWYSFSVWAKSSDRNLVINADFLMNARSGFNLSTGTTANTTSGTATITEYPNGWYKCTVTGQATTSHTQQLYIQMQTGTTDANYTGNGSSNISLFGAQFEAGTYTTSYIPTSGSAVTRTEDKCLNAGDVNLFNDTEGTLFLDIENFSGNTREITLSNGFTSNRVAFLFYGSTNKLRFFVASGGATQVDSLFTINYNFNQRNKVAFRYKQNDFKAYINGTQVFSTASGNTPVGLSRLDFSNSNGTANFIESKIYQAIYFNTALTDSELQTLTS
jgi:hypothetical protein